MEAQLDRLCSTNFTDLEYTACLVVDTKYVRENSKPELKEIRFEVMHLINHLTPNDDCSGCTAPLTSKRYILYIYSTNICPEYF